MLKVLFGIPIITTECRKHRENIIAAICKLIKQDRFLKITVRGDY